MSRKKYYPGGFRLTLKKARELAVQEFGTAKGLETRYPDSDGYFEMVLGNLIVHINPDPSCSGCIEVRAHMNGGHGTLWQLHDRETLERHYKEEDIYGKKERREALEEWICDDPEPCHKEIDDCWDRMNRRR